MLTAKEAAELSGPTLEEILERVSDKIKSRAAKGERWTRLDFEPFVHGAYRDSKTYTLAKTRLEELGYKVSFVFDCGQFVDMYTKVEW